MRKRAIGQVLRAGWVIAFGGATLLASGSWANQAHFAGPSVLPVASAATFNAGNFAPGTAVTVVVRQPNGAESASSVMVDANGKIAYSITPAVEGVYTLRVTDPGGRQLASTNFLAR